MSPRTRICPRRYVVFFIPYHFFKFDETEFKSQRVFMLQSIFEMGM
jgi:hypothetical protein